MRRILLATCLLLPITLAAAQAETLHFQAIMKGSSEVPPTGSAGTGTVDASLDTGSKLLTYTVTWSGLTGVATMAHFHGPAPVGKNAGVEITLGMSPVSPVHGTATLTDPQLNDLEHGNLYVNVHTAAHKGGEIRGQLLPAT